MVSGSSIWHGPSSHGDRAAPAARRTFRYIYNTYTRQNTTLSDPRGSPARFA